MSSTFISKDSGKNFPAVSITKNGLVLAGGALQGVTITIPASVIAKEGIEIAPETSSTGFNAIRLTLMVDQIDVIDDWSTQRVTVQEDKPIPENWASDPIPILDVKAK